MKIDILPEFNTVEYSHSERQTNSLTTVFNVRCTDNGIITKVKLLGLVQLVWVDGEFDGVFLHDCKTFKICLVNKLCSLFPHYYKGEIELFIDWVEFDLTGLFLEEKERLINDENYRTQGVKENWDKYILPYCKLASFSDEGYARVMNG